MTVARVDLYRLIKRMIAAQNAGVAASFTGVVNDDRRSLGELFASAQGGDDQVCFWLASTEGGSYRTLFTADSADLTHGEQLPDHIGSPGQVKIKYVSGGSWQAGKFDESVSLSDIENWRTNVGSIYGAAHDAANSSTAGFYRIQGDEIFYTGSTAKAKLATYTRSSRTVVDGVTTSASKTLTSATAVFTAADVGAAVLLSGAGVSDVPFLSRIEGFTNSTTVTLLDAAGASAAGQTLMIAKAQTPENLEDAALATAMVTGVKEGDRAPYLQVFAQKSDQYAVMIKAGAEVIPPLQIAQAA